LLEDILSSFIISIRHSACCN